MQAVEVRGPPPGIHEGRPRETGHETEGTVTEEEVAAARAEVRQALEYAMARRRPWWERLRSRWVDRVWLPAALAVSGLLCRLLGHRPAVDLNAPLGIPLWDVATRAGQVPTWCCPRCFAAVPPGRE